MKSTIKTLHYLGISKIDDNYLANYLGCTLRLKRLYARELINDFDLWDEIYLPIDVRNKAVLDVGSGCGETMAFFFAHGAKKVIGIEADPEACMFARTNIWDNRWNAEVINQPFSLQHLRIPHDLLKVNVEGSEQILLGYEEELGPCAIKVLSFGSSLNLPRIFLQRFRDSAVVWENKSRSNVLNGYDNSGSTNNDYDKVGSIQRGSSGQEIDLFSTSQRIM